MLTWKALDLESDFDRWMMKFRERFQPGKVLSETVTATALCRTGQGKAKGIEAGCKERDVAYVAGMKQSCLMWWDRHRSWNRKTDPDELG